MLEIRQYENLMYGEFKRSQHFHEDAWRNHWDEGKK